MCTHVHNWNAYYRDATVHLAYSLRVRAAYAPNKHLSLLLSNFGYLLWNLGFQRTRVGLVLLIISIFFRLIHRGIPVCLCIDYSQRINDGKDMTKSAKFRKRTCRNAYPFVASSCSDAHLLTHISTLKRQICSMFSHLTLITIAPSIHMWMYL